MRRTVPARLSLLAAGVPAVLGALGALLSTAGCGGGHGHGGGGGGGGGGTSPITAISPSVIDSEIPTPLVLTGSGFTPTGGPVVVRFVAESGTPFLGGAASFVAAPGIIDSFTQVSCVSPTLGVTGSVLGHVTVVLPSSATLDSEANSLTVRGPALSSLLPSSLPASSATPFIVRGGGFGPLNGSATVTFTATAGTPFAGGSSASASVPGTVSTSTRIAATSPVATTPSFSATVMVTFPSGATAVLPGTFPFAPAGGTSGGLVVTTDASPVLRVYLGQETTFHVTVTEAGFNVSLRLIDPPAGLEMAPIVSIASPVTATLRWQVPLGTRLGETPLVFEANDSTTPLLVTRFSVWADVEPTQAVRVVDVTGDGREDLVAVASQADPAGVANAGAVYVFAGGTSPASAPTAVLTVPGAVPLDQLGVQITPSDVNFLVGDVNGDGKPDVVVGAPFADALVVDSGVIYVWFGGPGLVGTKGPDARLTVAGATPNDRLRLRLLADVTGDGTLDVVGGSPLADAGAVDAGALYVWMGGALLTGIQPPFATLAVAAPTAADGIGQFVRAADITGDGTLDVVTWSSNVNVAAKAAVGAVYAWKGGATLVGAVAPDFAFTNAAGTANDKIGANVEGDATDAVRLVDVTGDGIADVVAVAHFADVAVIDAGAVYLWRGGALPTGLRPPDATMSGPGALIADRLGFSGLYLADVAGTGTLDIVAMSRMIDFAAVDSGGGYVWLGGAGLLGIVPPAATLRVPTAHPGEALGNGVGTIRLADVSGDGRVDILADAWASDFGSAVLVGIGEVEMWLGGAGLVGVKPPDATMTIAGANNLDQLGHNGSLLVGDVSGDGVLDVVVTAPDWNSTLAGDVGAAFVYRGGAGLIGGKTEDARCSAATAAISDMLGFSDATVGGAQTGASLADVSGDGVLDVVVRAERADLSLPDVGAFYVFRGGAGLTGNKTEDASLTVLAPTAADRLGGRVGFGTRVLDVSGDGIADVTALAVQTTVSGTPGAGEGYVFKGGAAMLGAKNPDAALHLAAPTGGEMLGQSSLTLADITADGTTDVLIGSTLLAPLARGGVACWAGGASLTGAPTPTAVFQDPAGTAGDGLGQ